METELESIIQETHDVKTFRFKRPADLKFLPGQYCSLEFPDVHGESRPFTFSSSPTEKGFFELTVKEMGVFTHRLFSSKPGDIFRILGPFGEKLILDESATEIAFIAGGSGITPFMSMIRYVFTKALPVRMTLIFGNRTKKDIIYHSELDKFQKLRTFHILSNEPSQSWKGPRGRMTRSFIDECVPERSEVLWYICGPPPMVSSIQGILGEIHVRPEKIRIENWQLPGKGDIHA